MPRVTSADGKVTAFIDLGQATGQIHVRDIRFRSYSGEWVMKPSTVTLKEIELAETTSLGTQNWPVGTRLYRKKIVNGEHLSTESSPEGQGAAHPDLGRGDTVGDGRHRAGHV